MDGLRRPGRFGAGLLVGIVGTLAVLAALALFVILGGRYDVAAAAGPGPVTDWALGTARERAVERRAAGLAPPRLAPADLRAGGEEYGEYCVHCHGAPGAEPHDWASGMAPRPPRLTRAARGMETNEIFWVVKHGIGMTGMPPFGDDHDDRTLWSIAAFVKQLPAMSPAQYRALAGEPAAAHSH